MERIARGVFVVRRGRSLLARLICVLSNLPRTSDACNVVLRITESDGKTFWSREFEGQRIVSMHQTSADSVLVEKFGLLLFTFELTYPNEVMTFNQKSVRLNLGATTLPLPIWLIPRVDATQAPLRTVNGQVMQAHVWVNITAPWFGDLLFYEGDIEFEEPV